ncbi:ABC transporter permease [Salipaludibacillus agaradhaerens]|uniref:ABC transporter permease n=1 Tax=Salipaludibacillus agaradhaerens TaxID=76935 RepID=A0A9Q4B2B6_SALAG|nr:ABC transporter permease [Salipaludibacillus agaradhaerens]MCR6097029.1 ABC transporter permease [Salipaludibacillus agaradhaerens]MCR6113486.1 ABC transporter permease [Salipaludibacillus agaradhaerens]
MTKFFIIMLHTFRYKVLSKSFIFSTLLTLFVVGGITNIDRIIAFVEEEKVDKIAVIAEEEVLYFELEEESTVYADDYTLEKIELTISQAEQEVIDGKWDGLLLLTLNEAGLPEANYRALTMADQGTAQQLEQALQLVKVARATEKLGIEEAQLHILHTPVSFNIEALSETAKTETELNTARFLVNILVVVIYFSVIAYGNMIALEVATEKSSRVMEILISSVHPVIQLFAKISGIALLGIVQFLLILVVGVASIRENIVSGGVVSDLLSVEEVPLSILFYAFIFFVLGYLFYATISAVLGSLVSRIEDVNQLITPLTLIIVVAFLISMFGLTSPDSTIVTIASYIPFFTPMVMFLRFGMLDLSIWEMILGISLLVISISVLGIIGARIYKGGVLLYGKTSSLKDIKQALALSKKNKPR